MTCERVRFGDSYAIICMRGQRPRKTWDCECGKKSISNATLECPKCNLYRDGCPACDADMQPVEGHLHIHKCEKCGLTLRIEGGAVIPMNQVQTTPKTGKNPTNEPKRQPILKRVDRQLKPRKTIFAGNWRQYPCVNMLNSAAAAGVQVIYLVGGTSRADSPTRQWYAAPVAQGWEILSEFDDHAFAVKFQREADRYIIDVRMSAIWFGDETHVQTLKDSYIELENALRLAWNDQHVCLWGTPAATGMDLFQRSIGWNMEYPILDDETRELLYHNCPQGRIEMLTLPEVTTIPGFYHLDARWQYAACLGELPGRLVSDDTVDQFAGPYIPAFYRVKAIAPLTWQHVGLLPKYEPKSETTIYPVRPGWQFTSFAGNAEIDLALKNGWDIKIERRLIFAKADPARTWLDRMKKLRDATENPLIAAAIRNMVIGTIGAWHRRATKVKHITPLSKSNEIKGAIPGSVTPTENGIEWYSWADISTAQQPYQHPEWSGAVWSRARARIAAAALQLPREALIAFRTDAISASANPDWPDTGKPGDWRPKIAHAGELAAPHDYDAYMSLRNMLEAAEARK